MERAGIPLRVVRAEIDEAVRPGEAPTDYLQRVVGDKLAAVAARVSAQDGAALLVADTSVVLEGEILGKPENVDEAERMIARLVGRAHDVMTRYALLALDGRATPVERTVVTRVVMRPASRSKVRRYAETGEGLDKAGAYAVQGLGAEFVARIEGSYTNVVGLPLAEVMMDLEAAGLLLDPS